MANAERKGIKEVRQNFGQVVDLAHYREEQTVITKNGRPVAVLVSYEWWERHQHEAE